MKFILAFCIDLLAGTAPASVAQEHLVLCRAGLGNFSSKFTSGVTVTVDATKAGAFSTHTCAASLSWGKEVMPVARESWEIDIDAMGANLGMNTPVVAFQIKSAQEDQLMTYKIYSLEKPPRLLRTVTGGDWFSAADTKLEGRTEIWTSDAGAVDGFEDIPLSSFDFAPTVVLRFEKQQLIDAGSEYQPFYDSQIAKLKSELDARALGAFKTSDGKPQARTPSSVERIKIKVLEIVWAYLYSGREKDAWDALAALWPAVDLDRIRASIVAAQARGIRSQVDDVSSTNSHPIWKHHEQVYNMDTESKGIVDMYSGQVTPLAPSMPSAGPGLGEKTSYSVDAEPKPIFLGTPLSPDGNGPRLTSKVYLNLVVDEAGKVRSASLANKSDEGPVGDMELGAIAGWKFIPAFRDGRAVACRFRFGISPYR